MKIIFTLTFTALASFCWSNNVSVSNVNLVGQDTVANTYQIDFDLSWENSWRTSTLESNYDAVWIFVKYREIPDTAWLHADVRSSGSVAPAGAEFSFVNGIGLMVYRDSDGIGNVDFDNLSIRWDYANDFPDDQALEISVHAIEMVYIPEGAFEVGSDGGSPVGEFQSGITTNPLTITSESSLTLGGTTAGNLNTSNGAGMTTSDDFDSTTTQTLSASFPKGFNDFYIMKYEITQEQYTNFLNQLSTTAANNRFPNQAGNFGHNITNDGSAPLTYQTSTPDRPCNYLEWEDVAAYADWSGLRPISELEYEKACRGSIAAVPNEFAWGTPFVFDQGYSLANSGTPSESIQNGGGGQTGNALYSDTNIATFDRPFRSGIFASSAPNPTRVTTGGSYYGVMELSGNLWEITVSVGDFEGRAFSGAFHGNGIITSSGAGTVATWPEDSSFSADYGDGIGLRGGSFSSASSRLEVSNRELANFGADTRLSDVGARLARTGF